MPGRLSYVEYSSTLLWIVVCGRFVSSADSNYLYEHRSDVSDSARGTRTTVSDEFFAKFWREQNQGLCPAGQVPQRNNTVCCWVNSCQPEFEIEECRANGTQDTCQKCKDGYTQPNNVSSLDMDNAKCFEVHATHKFCPEEYKATKEPFSDVFSLNCQCRVERCYTQFDSYGICREKMLPCDFNMQLDEAPRSTKAARHELVPSLHYPCQCKFEECRKPDGFGFCPREDSCGLSYQMNPTNGTCELCPWYAYKNEEGCQPCTLNITLLRYDGADVYCRSKTTKAVSTPGTARADNQPGLNSSLLFGLIFALIGVLFLMNTLVVIYLCRKRHVSTPVSQDDNSLL